MLNKHHNRESSRLAAEGDQGGAPPSKKDFLWLDRFGWKVVRYIKYTFFKQSYQYNH